MASLHLGLDWWINARMSKSQAEQLPLWSMLTTSWRRACNFHRTLSIAVSHCQWSQSKLPAENNDFSFSSHFYAVSNFWLTISKLEAQSKRTHKRIANVFLQQIFREHQIENSKWRWADKYQLKTLLFSL